MNLVLALYLGGNSIPTGMAPLNFSLFAMSQRILQQLKLSTLIIRICGIDMRHLSGWKVWMYIVSTLVKEWRLLYVASKTYNRNRNIIKVLYLVITNKKLAFNRLLFN
jgi:hypothetical protein